MQLGHGGALWSRLSWQEGRVEPDLPSKGVGKSGQKNSAVCEHWEFQFIIAVMQPFQCWVIQRIWNLQWVGNDKPGKVLKKTSLCGMHVCACLGERWKRGICLLPPYIFKQGPLTESEASPRDFPLHIPSTGIRVRCYWAQMDTKCLPFATIFFSFLFVSQDCLLNPELVCLPRLADQQTPEIQMFLPPWHCGYRH